MSIAAAGDSAIRAVTTSTRSDHGAAAPDDVTIRQVEQQRASLVQEVGEAAAILEVKIRHKQSRQPMVVADVVADVGAGQQTRL